MYHVALTTFVRYDNISQQQFRALQAPQHKHQRTYTFYPQKNDPTIIHKYLVVRQFMTRNWPNFPSSDQPPAQWPVQGIHDPCQDI